MSKQEWLLVPVKANQAMIDEGCGWNDDGAPVRVIYQHMLAARPPMPRATFDAMVERAARAMGEREFGKGCPVYSEDLWNAEAALRAALPGLKVEGDGE